MGLELETSGIKDKTCNEIKNDARVNGHALKKIQNLVGFDPMIYRCPVQRVTAVLTTPLFLKHCGIGHLKN